MSAIIKFDFKELPLKERKELAINKKRKYPDRCAIICEVAKNTTDPLVLDKTKFLVPYDMTIGGFLYLIKKRVKLLESQALFIKHADGSMPRLSATMKEVLNEHIDEDGFLYFYLSQESVFG